MKVTVEIPDDNGIVVDDASMARLVERAVRHELQHLGLEGVLPTVYWVAYGAGDLLMAFNEAKGAWELSS